MVKKTKYILVGLFLLLSSYISLYYYVTHDLDVNIQVTHKLPKKAYESISKIIGKNKLNQILDGSQSDFYSVADFVEKSCRKKVPFFFNPYKRAKELQTCIKDGMLQEGAKKITKKIKTEIKKVPIKK